MFKDLSKYLVGCGSPVSADITSFRAEIMGLFVTLNVFSGNSGKIPELEVLLELKDRSRAFDSQFYDYICNDGEFVRDRSLSERVPEILDSKSYFTPVSFKSLKNTYRLYGLIKNPNSEGLSSAVLNRCIRPALVYLRKHQGR